MAYQSYGVVPCEIEVMRMRFLTKVALSVVLLVGSVLSAQAQGMAKIVLRNGTAVQQVLWVDGRSACTAPRWTDCTESVSVGIHEIISAYESRGVKGGTTAHVDMKDGETFTWLIQVPRPPRSAAQLVLMQRAMLVIQPTTQILFIHVDDETVCYTSGRPDDESCSEILLLPGNHKLDATDFGGNVFDRKNVTVKRGDIIEWSVAVTATAAPAEGEGRTKVVFVNNTLNRLEFMVEWVKWSDRNLCYVESPGGTCTATAPSGRKTLKATYDDGTLAATRVVNLEPGKTFTWTVGQ